MELVILALNAVNEASNGNAFETNECEELCAYIDESLTEHDVDIVALTDRHGLGRYQLTDKWRKWRLLSDVACWAPVHCRTTSGPEGAGNRGSRGERKTSRTRPCLRHFRLWLH